MSPHRTDAPALPRVAEDAVFVPAERLGGTAHVVVDGPRLPGTALALSHWPDSGTPAAVAADTSALIVDRYLRAGPAGPEIGAVTNNHFDEDGLLAIWLLLERPPEDAPERALALSAAEAGDFGTWTDPWAARVAVAAMAMAERPTTPFPEVARALARAGGRDPAGELYLALLPRVPRLLRDPERHRALWRPRWERVARDGDLLDAGAATIADHAAADLAVIRAPHPLDEMAVHPRTPRMRVLTATPDGRLDLYHRYETWVRYASRALPPRVDLTALLPRLEELETLPGAWRFDGVTTIRARLRHVDAGGRDAPSGIAPERIAEEIARFLEARAAA